MVFRGAAMESLGASIEVPILGVGHRRILFKLVEAGFHIMIIIYGIEANFDPIPLIQAMENCFGNPVLLKLKGKTFERFTASDLLMCGVKLPPSVFQALECKLPFSLSQMEDMDGLVSEASPNVDVIKIKQNGLIEITGIVVKNQIDFGIKWTVIDGVEKAKSGFEKLEGSPELTEVCSEVPQGSHISSSVTSESSALVNMVISSLLKMLRFIGVKAQISYSGGISAIVGVVPSLLQPDGSAKTAASVDYVRMVALASGCLFAAVSGMLTISKSKKDLGIITAACAFFSMMIGLFSTIFSQIDPEYRACVISVFMVFLLFVALYASRDWDIETTCECGGDRDASSSTSPGTKSFSSDQECCHLRQSLLP